MLPDIPEKKRTGFKCQKTISGRSVLSTPSLMKNGTGNERYGLLRSVQYRYVTKSGSSLPCCPKAEHSGVPQNMSV